MTEEKISPETATMLTMQRLIGIAEELFDHIDGKDDDTFMVITLSPKYIHCDTLKSIPCEECGKPQATVLADLTFNRETKLSHWYK